MRKKITIISLLFILVSISVGVYIFVFQKDTLQRAKMVILHRRSPALESAVKRYPLIENQIEPRGKTMSDLNVILILTDDQSFGTVQYMPQLSRLAEESGAVFNNAIVANPICCSSRAGILSGGYLSRDTGVKRNAGVNGGLDLLDESKTLPMNLYNSGVVTGFVGKYLHEYSPGYIPPGWDSFVANEKGSMLRNYNELFNITYGSSNQAACIGAVKNRIFPKNEYVTTFQTNEALKFIRDNANHTFFLLLSYYAPHNPYIVEHSEDWDFARSVPFEVLPEMNLSERPDWVEVMGRDVALRGDRFGHAGEKAFRGQIALLQSIDRGVKAIFDELVKLKIKEKTLVIFTSDNGKILGEVLLYPDKGFPYDGALRVPLIVFSPEFQMSESLRGRQISVTTDVPASIYDIYNLDAPTDGYSIFEEYSDRHLLIEDYGYLDYRKERFGVDLPFMGWAGIRTDKFKYIEWANGDVEFYDLEIDPYERENLSVSFRDKKVLSDFHRELEIKRGLVILSNELTDARVAEEYNFKLLASGAALNATWSISEGELPEGILLNTLLGEISGKTEGKGYYDFHVTIRGRELMKHTKRNEEFTQKFTLHVN